MKVQWILQSIINESLGMATLSALLKQRGHAVGLTIGSRCRSVRQIVDAVKASNPQIIVCSVMTAQAAWYESVCKAIKQELPNTAIVWGGAHPTFMPELCPTDCVDFVFVGESDKSFIDFVEAGPTASSRIIQGLPFQNLDSLPFPDRNLLYDQSWTLRHFNMKRVISTRGCPFSCSYCFEPALRKLYDNAPHFVRRHSPDYVLAEIKDTLSRFPGGKHIHFSDDSFNLSWSWMQELLPRFASEVGLSYSVNLAVPLVTAPMIKLLADTGCRGVVVGLETGNERLRREVLKKPVTDKQFYFLAECLKSTKIKLITNVMFALPGDSIDDWMMSIDMMRKLHVHEARPCILKAYRGSAIAERVEKLPHVKDRFTIKEVRSDNADVMLWLSWLYLAVPIPLSWCKTIAQSRFSGLLRFCILFSYLDFIWLFRLTPWQAFVLFWENKKLLWDGMAAKQGQEASAGSV